MKGKVKWFNDSKGYGFIETDAYAHDVFVHYADIDCEGFKTLVEGQTVEFELITASPKGPQAIHVKKVSEHAALSAAPVADALLEIAEDRFRK